MASGENVKFSAGGGANELSVMPTMTLVGVEETKATLELRYVVQNTLSHDIWLCDVMDVRGMDFESYWPEGSQMLMIRRRSDIPVWFALRDPPLSRYIRLRAGESRTESLLLPIPVRPQSVVASNRKPAEAKYVERLALEYGYYTEDAAKAILDTLATEEASRTDDEFFVYHHSGELLKQENVLYLEVNGLHVPCAQSRNAPGESVPDLSGCTRMEISYEPSMLAYFLPYPDQQILLNSAERALLGSPKTVVVENERYLTDLTQEMSHGRRRGLILEGAKANMTCQGSDGQLLSVCLCHDSLLTNDRKSFYYPKYYHDGGPHLDRVTPQVQPFISRIQCANNMKDLRLRLHHYVRQDHRYPSAHEWCDAVTNDWNARYVREFVARPFVCPSAPKGRCHYAMNSDCTASSPEDVVLLFETHAGWNQHGGPEMFTFSNHDPRGGLVLLNSGRVKFIRTEEELKQLRWK